MNPKFRFYHSKLNKIYEVVGIDHLNEQVDCILPEMNGDISNWDWSDGELIQPTRLKDKNGVEIFEGDVVKTKYGEHGRHIGVVKYGGAKFYSNGVKQYLSWHEDLNGLFEIIGNQFEHPYLLEGDNE
ncbi:YopX family protein [Staphylococcus saprophyticus]|uniref:YopX family protein n=1 Tax=Staphylococcus saprophyticus TaxID=29385 RepID=UPI0036533399